MKLQNSEIPYSYQDLFQRGRPMVYTGRQLDNIAFPLGGIGTGCISFGGWGQFRDAEIWNLPNKGEPLPYAWFTLNARTTDGPSVTKLLQGPVGSSDFTGSGSGVDRRNGAGLPHFAEAEFVGRFPYAELRLRDPQVPLEVTVEAYNPFIPGNADDSGLPAAMFTIALKNGGNESVKAVLYANCPNLAGYPEAKGGRTEYVERDGAYGLVMSTTRHEPESPRYGSMALVSPLRPCKVLANWRRGTWFDSLHDFWDQAKEGELRDERGATVNEDGFDVGSLAFEMEIPAGETRQVPIWYVWHTPNFRKEWEKGEDKPIWRNYYATLHADAGAVAGYLGQHHQRLEEETRLFADSLFASTLPTPVMDAVTSQLSILKSTTCLRLEDGTFYGYEGCSTKGGCCEGTCTHVWNYAQALPYLFPALERTVRDAEFTICLGEDGHMTFRLPLPIGRKPDGTFHAATDGQLGCVMKVYREWLIHGDDAWLAGHWPRVKKALEYAWQQWDKDKDGCMEGVQHNTYDIEFHGPNTMLGTFYLGALRAAEEMAMQLDDLPAAEEYRRLFEQGQALYDALLFNGDYYVQDVRRGEDCDKQGCHGATCTPSDTRFPENPAYQYGDGCLSDQLIGQWYGRMLRLGDFLDADNMRQTLTSIFANNWKASMREHANPQRIYALNDEAGLLLCTWPRGNRPGLPFVYSDEVWCGIEYQVASHLIFEGFVEEGLAIVKGVRDRHDGSRRNPWNEFECGNHYARSLASYALLLAVSDFFYSAPAQSLSFSPKVYKENFACFFSVDSGWGMLRQKAFEDEGYKVQVRMLRGKLTLANLQVGLRATEPMISLRDSHIDYEAFPTEVGMVLRLASTVTIEAGETLEIIM